MSILPDGAPDGGVRGTTPSACCRTEGPHGSAVRHVELTPGASTAGLPSASRAPWNSARLDVDDGSLTRGWCWYERGDAGDRAPGHQAGTSGPRGKLLLIDVFFVQVPPLAMAEAVDLGKMMLVLAVRTDRRCHKRASPTHRGRALGGVRRESGGREPDTERAFMKRDRAPARRYSASAPRRGGPTVSAQRWSVRRVRLAAGMIAAITLARGGGPGKGVLHGRQHRCLRPAPQTAAPVTRRSWPPRPGGYSVPRHCGLQFAALQYVMAGRRSGSAARGSRFWLDSRPSRAAAPRPSR